MPRPGETAPSTQLVVPAGVLGEIIDGEAVLLHLETGKYFSLNRTGTRMWQLIRESTPEPRIVSMVAEEFSVPEGRVSLDLRVLVSELAARGLVVVRAIP